MTAAALTPSKEYIENGVTLAYAVPFRFRAVTHIKAQRISAAGVVTELAYGTDYSVTGGETDAGGTLTVTVAGAVGTRLRIRRETPRSQDMDYTTGDTFPAESHEAALDKAMLIDQEQDQKIDDTANRAYLVPDGENAGVLPSLSQRVGRFFGWGPTGDAIASSGTGNDPNLRTDLANSLLGALLVAWKAAGAGAVVRTVWAKLADLPLSPEDFGALGNNASVDGPAIQAAFTAAGAANIGRVVIKGKNYITNQELTLGSDIELLGEGRELSKISAGPALGHNNIISASGKSGIRIKGIGFIGLNQTVMPDFASTAKENLLYFMSCSDVIIEDCYFSRALYRNILFDASVGSPMSDITIRNCEFENGSRGGIFVVRYATNIFIHRNKLTNTVNSVIGGITFEKSISVTGTTNGYIYDNTVVQTNTDAASIIAEYVDTASENIHIFRNTVTYDSAQVEDNCIKAGAVTNLKIYDNVCVYAYAAGIFLEGCTDFEIYRNDISLCGDNGIKAVSDTSPTANPSKRGRIWGNTITDCNQNGGALGTVGVGGAANGSYAIFIDATASEIDIYRNTFIDSGNMMNGLFINSSTYTITDNDFRALNAARITINNNSSSGGTKWLIRDNKGAQTTAQGTGTLTNGNNSVVITPDIVSQYDPNVQVTLKEALTASAAYWIAAPDTPPAFAFQTKTAAHGTANVSADLDFGWTADLSRTAKGIFGKTAA